MKVGDLVRFCPDGEYGRTLTAVKYYARIQKLVGAEMGIIVSMSGNNCLTVFGDKQVVLHERHLEVINGAQSESR